MDLRLEGALVSAGARLQARIRRHRGLASPARARQDARRAHTRDESKEIGTSGATVEFFSISAAPPPTWRGRNCHASLGAGATLVYRPMLLGGVFRIHRQRQPGQRARQGSLDEPGHPALGGAGVLFAFNLHFPINTLTLMRGAVGMQMHHPARFEGYCRTIFDAMWSNPRNLGEPAELAAVLEAAGFEVGPFISLVAIRM